MQVPDFFNRHLHSLCVGYWWQKICQHLDIQQTPQIWLAYRFLNEQTALALREENPAMKEKQPRIYWRKPYIKAEREREREMHLAKRFVNTCMECQSRIFLWKHPQPSFGCPCWNKITLDKKQKNTKLKKDFTIIKKLEM